MGHWPYSDQSVGPIEPACPLSLETAGSRPPSAHCPRTLREPEHAQTQTEGAGTGVRESWGCKNSVIIEKYAVVASQIHPTPVYINIIIYQLDCDLIGELSIPWNKYMPEIERKSFPSRPQLRRLHLLSKARNVTLRLHEQRFVPLRHISRYIVTLFYVMTKLVSCREVWMSDQDSRFEWPCPCLRTRSSFLTDVYQWLGRRVGVRARPRI